MTEDLSRTIVWSAAACLFVLGWLASARAASWHLNRRHLPQAERRAWLALVLLLPGWGVLAYGLSLVLGLLFPLPPTGARANPGRRRITLLKPLPQPEPRTGTIAAADLVHETIAERRPASAVPLAFAVVAGPHSGAQFAVDPVPARLGRGGSVRLRLDQDLGVSRQHAEIYQRDGQLRIRDLRSHHGTFVNGQRIDDHALALGDRIEVGHSALVVKDLGA